MSAVQPGRIDCWKAPGFWVGAAILHYAHLHVRGATNCSTAGNVKQLPGSFTTIAGYGGFICKQLPAMEGSFTTIAGYGGFIYNNCRLWRVHLQQLLAMEGSSTTIAGFIRNNNNCWLWRVHLQQLLTKSL